MGDKEANAVQRGMNTYCLPTHTVPGPFLFHVLSGKDSVVCLPAISPVTSSQTISISMASQECNRVTGEFPHSFLRHSMNLALSCIRKTSVEFFSHNANCVYFSQCELRGMQVCCKHVSTKIRGVDMIIWAPDAMHYVIHIEKMVCFVTVRTPQRNDVGYLSPQQSLRRQRGVKIRLYGENYCWMAEWLNGVKWGTSWDPL